MIKLTKVSKKYPNDVLALDNVDVFIDQGEFVYIIGPSGAGKSTFIKSLYREEKIDSGTIQVGKFTVDNMKDKDLPDLRRFVGVVFQDFKLLQNRTVFENVAYAMEVVEKSPKQIEKRTHEVLKQVGLGHKAEMFPNELSGGEQQRVALARAIANMPSVIIADEPTGNLDPETSQEIMDILQDINDQGTTVIMATHNSHIVNVMRHRVLEIEDGKIMRDEEKGRYSREASNVR